MPWGKDSKSNRALTGRSTIGRPVTPFFCSMPSLTDFAPYIDRWALTPDGESIATGGARLLPVQWQGQPAMLKIALVDEERRGFDVLARWGGQGAAQVFARDEDHAGQAILMERACGTRSLAQMSVASLEEDDAATDILCTAVAGLHRWSEAQPRSQAMSASLVALPDWFRALEESADTTAPEPYAVLLRHARTALRELLAEPRDVRVLHGDVHHQNLLDFGARGWLFIDPKGLVGERGFDYANLFCNPDARSALDPLRFHARLLRVSLQAQLPRERLLQWIVAWTGLSAVWHLEDGGSPAIALGVMELALQA